MHVHHLIEKYKKIAHTSYLLPPCFFHITTYFGEYFMSVYTYLLCLFSQLLSVPLYGNAIIFFSFQSSPEDIFNDLREKGRNIDWLTPGPCRHPNQGSNPQPSWCMGRCTNQLSQQPGQYAILYLINSPTGGHVGYFQSSATKRTCQCNYRARIFGCVWDLEADLLSQRVWAF